MQEKGVMRGYFFQYEAEKKKERITPGQPVQGVSVEIMGLDL